MHSALFVATIPTIQTHWNEFLMQSEQKLRQSKGVAQLSENVWLLNLQENLAPLGYLVVAAERLGITYGILPFEHKPEWLPVGFYPGTKEGQKA